MLLICCPYCGPRDEIEYRWGGDSNVTRPLFDASDEEWTKYLYYRRNAKGPNLERWLHLHGCGQWFLITRDTLTHEIQAIESGISAIAEKAREAS